MLKIATSTIPGAGRGVFALIDFNRNDFICSYYGIFVTDDEYEWIDANAVKINTGVSIVKGSMHNPIRLNLIGFPGYPGPCINHHSSSNCEFVIYKNRCTRKGFKKGLVVVQATKKIKAGSEIFIHYGEEADRIINHSY
jgi:SET domain-containing protein